MPRPKKHIPTVRLEFACPENLYAILSTLFHDPLLGKPRFGAIAEYLIGLIREDLKRRGLLT